MVELVYQHAGMAGIFAENCDTVIAERPATHHGICRLIPFFIISPGAVVAWAVGASDDDTVLRVRRFAVKPGIPAAVEAYIFIETLFHSLIPLPVAFEKACEIGLFIEIVQHFHENRSVPSVPPAHIVRSIIQFLQSFRILRQTVRSAFAL